MEPLWGLANGIGRGVHRTLTLFVCLDEESDRGTKTTGAAGTLPRCALGHVLSHLVGASGGQRQNSLLEVPREAQPFVKMLADNLVRVAKFQQTTTNLVHALLVR